MEPLLLWRSTLENSYLGTPFGKEKFVALALQSHAEDLLKTLVKSCKLFHFGYQGLPQSD